MANVESTSALPAGAPARLHHARDHHDDMRRLHPSGQRVFLRQAPGLLQLDHQLLPHGQAAPDRGRVPGVVQRRPRVLGHRRALHGVVLPAQVPHQEGTARGRAAADRGEFAAAGGGGLRFGVSGGETAAGVGLDGKAKFVNRS